MPSDRLTLFDFRFGDIFPIDDPSKVEEIEFILTMAMIHNDLQHIWQVLKSTSVIREEEAESVLATSVAKYYTRLAILHVNGAMQFLEGRMPFFKKVNERRYNLYKRLRKRSRSLKLLLSGHAADLRDRLAHYAILDGHTQASVDKLRPLFELALTKHKDEVAKMVEYGRWVRFAFADDFALTLDKINLDRTLAKSDDDQVRAYVRTSINALKIFERVSSRVVNDYIREKSVVHPIRKLHRGEAARTVSVQLPADLLNTIKLAMGIDSDVEAVRTALTSYLTE